MFAYIDQPSEIQEEDESLIYIEQPLASRTSTEVLLYNIVTCESGWNPKACNSQLGCKEGMGLCQFISSTWNSLVQEFKEKNYDFVPERCLQEVHYPISEERNEMIFDPECNLIFCRYLLRKDGDRHWRPYSGSCYLNK